MIQKSPGNFELCRDFGGECFDAESLGGIMAAIENVQAKIFGQSVGPMATFTGDEGIDSFFGCNFQFVSGSSSDDADAAALFEPSRQQDWRLAQDFAQSGRQLSATDFRFYFPADHLGF